MKHPLRVGLFGIGLDAYWLASIIIFSTLWGVALREWKGTSRKTHVLIGLGLALLVLSTIVIGYGNYLAGSKGS